MYGDGIKTVGERLCVCVCVCVCAHIHICVYKLVNIWGGTYPCKYCKTRIFNKHNLGI